VGVAVVVASALIIDAHSVGGLELDVFRFLNEDISLPYGPVWVLMQLGSIGAIFGSAALALVYRRFRLTIALLLAGIGAWWLAKAVKAVIERPRPGALLADAHLRDAPTEGLGYVSGHAAVAAALASAAWPFLGRVGRTVAVVLVVVVCLSRIYVGAHFPVDVIGGAGLGLAIAAVVRFVVTPEPHRPAATPVEG
jgi:membrane-associated phospholipid phosphatase